MANIPDTSPSFALQSSDSETDIQISIKEDDAYSESTTINESSTLISKLKQIANSSSAQTHRPYFERAISVLSSINQNCTLLEKKTLISRRKTTNSIPRSPFLKNI
ncbi:hypothetical protein GEMRC1_001669 [Eukaryota sp. GEM-RC1]